MNPNGMSMRVAPPAPRNTGRIGVDGELVSSRVFDMFNGHPASTCAAAIEYIESFVRADFPFIVTISEDDRFVVVTTLPLAEVQDARP